MNRPRLVLASLPLLALAAAAAYAHNAICDCFDNGDDTITCEGGFSDGGKAVGVPVRVLDPAGKVLIDGKMSEQERLHVRQAEGRLQGRVRRRPGPRRHDRWPRH